MMMLLKDYHLADNQKTLRMDTAEDFGSFGMEPMTPTTPVEGFWSDFASPRDEWERMSNVFEYPPTGRLGALSIGINSPGSTGSEVNTPTSWTNGDYNEYSNDGMKLPSVGTAFSFSRNFCNSYFDEQSNYQEFSQDYQEYQDCSEGEANILNSQILEDRDFSNLQAVEEFDLSFIRGDPTNLFPEEHNQCFPVGHLVKSALSEQINYQIKEEIEENQVVVTQDDAMILEKCANGASSRKYNNEGNYLNFE